MDWYTVPPLVRLLFCLIVAIGFVGFCGIAALLGNCIWKQYLKRHPEESAIENPERVKVLAYDRKGNLKYWERKFPYK